MNSTTPDRHTIDASVVLAAILREPGNDEAAAALEAGGVMSAVNVSEVVARMLRAGLGIGPATAAIESFDILVLPFDRHAAYAIAQLEAPTRQWGLSMADRACLHAGQLTGLTIITADQAWSQLPQDELGVRIRMLR